MNLSSCVLFYLSVIFYSLSILLSTLQSVESCCILVDFVNIDILFVGQICIIILGFIWLILCSSCYLGVAFVTFDTNLSTLNKAGKKLIIFPR